MTWDCASCMMTEDRGNATSALRTCHQMCSNQVIMILLWAPVGQSTDWWPSLMVSWTWTSIKSSHEERSKQYQCTWPGKRMREVNLPLLNSTQLHKLWIIQWMCDETFSTNDDPMSLNFPVLCSDKLLHLPLAAQQEGGFHFRHLFLHIIYMYHMHKQSSSQMN